MFLYCPLYTCRRAGALVNETLAFLYTFKISIALAIHSFDPSGAFRGWCAGDLYRPP